MFTSSEASTSSKTGYTQATHVCILRCNPSCLQVPQYILEEEIASGSGGAANIVCTQPRRLPALALASRVSDEMGARCGSVVGYSVRLDKKTSRETRLLFCTTGILLRRLVSEPNLPFVSHVIIDEVHERSLESDLLMLLLRDALSRIPHLRLVLMSATADAAIFARYFDQVVPARGAGRCAIVSIPGFTYPVRELSLEDLIAATGAYSCFATRPWLPLVAQIYFLPLTLHGSFL
jgi:HrpA-like RNA helicase